MIAFYAITIYGTDLSSIRTFCWGLSLCWKHNPCIVDKVLRYKMYQIERMFDFLKGECCFPNAYAKHRSTCELFKLVVLFLIRSLLKKQKHYFFTF
jgi:hypothetical protein